MQNIYISFSFILKSLFSLVVFTSSIYISEHSLCKLYIYKYIFISIIYRALLKLEFDILRNSLVRSICIFSLYISK